MKGNTNREKLHIYIECRYQREGHIESVFLDFERQRLVHIYIICSFLYLFLLN